MKRVITIAVICLTLAAATATAAFAIEVESDKDTQTAVLNTEEKTDIATLNIEFESDEYEYDGSIHKPVLKLYFYNEDSEKEYVGESEYDVTYSDENPVYPGKYTVTVTAKEDSEDYTGTVSKTYTITYKHISSIKRSEITTSSFVLSWSKQTGASGYRIYRVSGSTFNLVSDINGNSTFKKSIENLSCGMDYNYIVRAYIKVDGEKREYAQTSTINVAIKPSKGKATGFTTVFVNNYPYLRAKWSERTCDQYQVQLSRSSKFKNASIITYNGNVTYKKFKTKVKNGQRYYFRVRAVNRNGSAVSYGSWSDKRVTTGKTARFRTVNGVTYRYVYGKKLHGQKTINGKPYYFSEKSGALLGSSEKMWKKVRNAKSKTKYLIAVSTNQCYACVYHKVNGHWRVHKHIKISCGKSTNPTPHGSFEVPSRKTRQYSFGHGYTVYYATRIWAHYYFHSIKYRPGSTTEISDGRLGKHISLGCIRMAKDNAKWIYKNVKAGTKVIIYS